MFINITNEITLKSSLDLKPGIAEWAILHLLYFSCTCIKFIHQKKVFDFIYNNHTDFVPLF